MKKLKDILEFVSKDTIYEKLDLNKVSLENTFVDYLIDNFIKMEPEDIIKYLEKNKFIYYNSKGEKLSKQRDVMNEIKNKVFILSDNTNVKVIKIANTSKREIDSKNPIFLIFYHKIANTLEFYTEFTTVFEHEIRENKFRNWLKDIF